MSKERTFRVGPSVFNKRLFAAMAKEGVKTPADLARKLNVNPQTAHKWLSGPVPNISAADAFKIGDKLNVSPKWLLGLSDDMAPGRKLDPERRRALDLYDQLEKLGGDWLDDWIADGHRTVEKVKKMPSIAAPFARK